MLNHVRLLARRGISIQSPLRAMSAAASNTDPVVSQPADVLDFWFGGLWSNPEAMRAPGALKDMNPLWWGTSPTWGPLGPEEKAAVDTSCQRFAELVRSAARGGLDHADNW